MIARTSAARAAASVVLAGALALGVAGCTFVVPQATLIQYDPSDGVGVTVGEVKVRNAILLLSEDGESASLLVTFVSESDDRINLDLQVDVDGSPVTVTKSIEAHQSISFGNLPDETKIVFEGLDAEPGALFPVYFQYGTEEGKQLLVPVLPADSAYSTLAPTATPTPTPTPTPTETATPEPTETPAP